jgi:hypothetical protein
MICRPFTTSDGGTTWVNLTDHIPSLGISGIVVSYQNANIIYVLTGDGDSNIAGLVEDHGYMRPSVGVMKSSDGGASWHLTGTFPGTIGQFVGYQLVQSPTDPEILLAATSDGLYRTTNGALTWVQERSGRHFDVAFKPGDGTRAYATVLGDFWLSTDSGDTWTSTSTYDIDPATCGGGGRIQIAVAPTNSTRVYLLSGPVTAGGQFCGLWRSTDGGVSFTRMSNTPNILGRNDSGNDGNDQSNYDLAIACRSDLSTTILTSGMTVWRSADSGVNWTHCTGFNENSSFPYIHPDVHDVEYNPLNNWVYAATDGGFFRSQDHGATWTDLSVNIESSQFYHMRGWDGHVNKLMGGLQDNGVKYRPANTTTYWHIDGADGFDVVFNPNTGEPGYASINRTVSKYSGNGSSSADVSPSGSIFFMPIAVHNIHPDTLLVGSSNIYRTLNGGGSYTNEGASGSWSLTSCPSNSSRFYAAGGSTYMNGSGSLYHSSDIGNTWTVKSGNTGFPDPDDWIKITDVTVRPNMSSVVWSCFGGFDAGVKVVMSTNTGDSWTNMSANLPNVPVNCLAIDVDNGAYAGTDIGVFYRGPSMNNWMPWSNGLPNVPVTDLYIYDNGSVRRLRAATFGRGLWQSNLAEACDAAIVVTGDLEGTRHYEASSSIQSSADVEGGAGTFVSFKSGSYITLIEGFEVIEDSRFLGFISPCGQGGIPGLNGETGIDPSRSPNDAIILLKRMYDPKDDLPYGAIENIQLLGDKARITIHLRQPGRTELVAARHIQDALTYLVTEHMQAGSHEFQVDISALPLGLHYFILFYEGRIAHFEELDLRR